MPFKRRGVSSIDMRMYQRGTLNKKTTTSDRAKREVAAGANVAQAAQAHTTVQPTTGKFSSFFSDCRSYCRSISVAPEISHRQAVKPSISATGATAPPRPHRVAAVRPREKFNEDRCDSVTMHLCCRMLVYLEPMIPQQSYPAQAATVLGRFGISARLPQRIWPSRAGSAGQKPSLYPDRRPRPVRATLRP